jgi:DNA-directed RNA polymerase specialized sigma24 family protein
MSTGALQVPEEMDPGERTEDAVSLDEILEARSKLEASERSTADVRDDFYRAVARAYDKEGISLSEIGRALDVSRQRVRVLVELGRKAG